MKFEEYLIKREELYQKQGEGTKEEKTLLMASNSLCGEVGEFANVVKKIYRDHNGNPNAMKDEVKEELGGVFWYVGFVLEVLKEHGIKAEDVLDFNYEQLKARYNLG